MKTDARLAIKGGPPAVTRKLPAHVRWGRRELNQLAAMLRQPSLFYWSGGRTRLLIRRFQARYPLKYVMPCSSGTAALHIAVAAAGVGPGDEVITSPITDMGTVIGILYQQGVPVFADLEPHRYNLDVADVARRITRRTRAIIAVHLTGNPCDLAGLRKLCRNHGLVLIEDCAQAWGAEYRGRPVGTAGDMGCWSLNDFKHIGCGDGGIVASSDPRFGPRLQKFGDKAYDRVGGGRSVDVLAPNYRISEPQSAVAAAQMTRLEAVVSKRAKLGRLLTRRITGIPGIQPHEVDARDRCSYWFYMFRLDLGRLTCDREAFVKALQAEGAPCVAGYIPEPVYHTPAFLDGNFFAGRWPVRELGLTRMDYAKVRCPVAEEIIRTAVRVGIGENMDATYVEQVAAAVRKVARYYRKPR